MKAFLKVLSDLYFKNMANALRGNHSVQKRDALYDLLGSRGQIDSAVDDNISYADVQLPNIRALKTIDYSTFDRIRHSEQFEKYLEAFGRWSYAAHSALLSEIRQLESELRDTFSNYAGYICREFDQNISPARATFLPRKLYTQAVGTIVPLTGGSSRRMLKKEKRRCSP